MQNYGRLPIVVNGKSFSERHWIIPLSNNAVSKTYTIDEPLS
jgi:hypothetical protein